MLQFSHTLISTLQPGVSRVCCISHSRWIQVCLFGTACRARVHVNILWTVNRPDSWVWICMWGCHVTVQCLVVQSVCTCVSLNTVYCADQLRSLCVCSVNNIIWASLADAKCAAINITWNDNPPPPLRCVTLSAKLFWVTWLQLSGIVCLNARIALRKLVSAILHCLHPQWETHIT